MAITMASGSTREKVSHCENRGWSHRRMGKEEWERRHRAAGLTDGDHSHVPRAIHTRWWGPHETHTQKHTHTHIHTHTHNTHTQTHMDTHTDTDTQEHAYGHTHTNGHTQTHIHRHTQTCTHMDTHTDTYRCTHGNTHRMQSLHFQQTSESRNQGEKRLFSPTL